jgi:hypothetical protein
LRSCNGRCSWWDPTFKSCLDIAHPWFTAYPILTAPGYMIK